MTRRQAPAPPENPEKADDSALFRDAVGPVRRLRDPAPRTDQRAPAPRPEPVQFLRNEARVLTELLDPLTGDGSAEIGEELLYLRDGHDPRLLRKLRRGQIAVQDEIDLHQMNLTTARECVREFLAEAITQGYRCVRIVHGKGLRSRQGPVLKTLVDGMLRQRGDIVAFASARHQDGGIGAVLVLLQRR